MKKAALWFSLSGLVLLVGGVIAYWYAANRDFFFKEIDQLVQEKTGYRVTKSGPLQFSVLPRPTLTGIDLTIINPQSGSAVTIAKVGRLSFVLPWQSLLADQPTLDVEIVVADIDLQIDPRGNSNWMTEELQTFSGGLPFDLDNIDAEKTTLRYTNHQTNEILGLDLDHFDVILSAGKSNARIDSAGRFGGSRFLAVGDVAYLSDKQQLDLSLALGAGEAQEIKVGDIDVPSVTAWIEQNAAQFPLHGLVEGSISLQDRVPYGTLRFKANLKTVDEFAYLAEELSYVQEGIGPAAASGVVLVNGSDFDIEQFEAALHHDHLGLEVKGNIYNLLSKVQFDLNTKMEVDSLKAVAAPDRVGGMAKNLVNRLGPIDIAASVKTEGDDIVVTELDLGFVHNTFTARIGGNLRLKEDDIHFDLDHHSGASDPADLFALLDIDYPGLPNLGAFSLSAKVSGQRDHYILKHASGHIQGENIKTTLGGEVSLIDEALNFDLDTMIDVKDMTRLVSLLPEEFTPYLQGLTGKVLGEIKGTPDSFSIKNLEINLLRDDRELHVSGNMADLPDDPKSRLDFHFVTEGAVELERYFPKLVDMQVAGPLDLVGTLRSAENKVYIEGIQFKAEQTDMEGGILIDLNHSPPYVFVIFDSQELYTKLVARDSDIDTGEEPAPVPAEPTDEPKSKISDKELGQMFKEYTEGVEIQTDWIKDLNLYLSLRAGKARLGAYNLDELYLTIDAREGVFTLAEYEVILGGRPISFRGSINTNFNPPTYEFSGKLEGDTLEALLNVEDNLFVGGELRGDFELRSEGSNLGELIRHLDGKALVTMGPLTIRSNALNVVSSDMLSGMLKGITRKPEDEPSSSYECGVLGVDVERGLAGVNKSFTMQAKDFNLAGNGKLDLNTGLVDLKVYPKARKGVGLSISTMVGGFKIKGHLAAPNFGLGGGGLVTAMVTGYALTPTVAASAANPATATILVTGLFAKGIFDRLTASNFTCKNTLKRIERRQTSKYQPRNHHTGKMSF